MRTGITHYLKCDIPYYGAMKRGDKKFWLGRNNRAFKIGDMVCFMETINKTETRDRNCFYVKIKYIQYDGLPKEFCIFNW